MDYISEVDVYQIRRLCNIKAKSKPQITVNSFYKAFVELLKKFRLFEKLTEKCASEDILASVIIDD